VHTSRSRGSPGRRRLRRAAAVRRGSRAQARRESACRVRQRDLQPRLLHRTRLRAELGRDEHRLRPPGHHPRRQVRAERRGVLADLTRWSPLHVQAQKGRRLPRRHRRRRRRGEVQHRPDHGPGHQVEHADLLRVGALGRDARPPHGPDQAQAALRVPAPHARGLPDGLRRPRRKSTPFRIASRASRTPSWAAVLSSWSSGSRAAIS